MGERIERGRKGKEERGRRYEIERKTLS